jgi:hypothetical protein
MAHLATLWSGLAIALLLAVSATSTAQAADPQGCTPQERSNHALTDQAGRNGGVICPPDVDPAIKSPTPDTGKMPVIPPPGSPGGNPNVLPK